MITKIKTPRAFMSAASICVFSVALLALGARTAIAQQWTGPDSSNNISNTNSGNVGIGTTSPTTLLDVTGGLRLRQNSGGNAAASLIEFSDRHSGWGMGLTWNLYYDGSGWKHRNADFGGILGFGDGTNQGDLLYWSAPWAAAGSNSSLIERFRITNSGNVGIGTPSPATRLQVNNDNNSTTFVNSPDFTFLLRNNNTTANNWVGFGFAGNRDDGVSRLAGSVGSQMTSHSNGSFTSDLVFNVTGAGESPIEVLRMKSSGNVGIGTTSPTEKLHVSGNVKVTGNLTVDGSFAAKYQDVAEWVPATESLPAGTVVVLDTTRSNQVTSSNQAYDMRVAGVISAQPGITLGEKSEDKVLVATTGRVRVKVDASRAPIHIGDLLVTSDIAGVAMKSEPVNLGGVQIHRPGTIIGKALEPLQNGKGEILVLLSLQ